MKDREAKIDDIKRSFKEGRLIPFVGAGLSMCVSGFPSWNDLIERLKSQIEGEKLDWLNSFSDQTPWVRVEFLKHLLTWGDQPIKEEIFRVLTEAECRIKCPKNDFPSSFTTLVGKDKFSRIYTTNYDHLIEIAAERKQRKYVTIYDLKSLLQARSCGHAALSIIKYHGDYRGFDTMLLTEDDYAERLLDVNALDTLLMNDMLFNDILFLGYGFQDQTLKLVVRQIYRLLKEIDPLLLTKDYNCRRPRFFLATTETRPAYILYFERAYLLETVPVITPSVTGEVVVDGEMFRFSTIPNGTGQTPWAFTDFSSLWKLAELSERGRLDDFEKAVQKEFPESPTRNWETLGRGFRDLRSKVLNEAYTSFLKNCFEENC